MSAIQFLAGLGAGYLEGDREKRRETRQNRMDQITIDEADARKAERARVNADRDALRTAAAPVPVEDGSVYQPANDDEGNPMPANPTTGTYKVGAARFATRGLAEQAATTQQRTNVGNALAAQDPLRAEQYRAAGMQGDAAEIQLKEAVTKMRNEGASRALSAALAGRSPEEVKALYNSQGDAKVGDLQIIPIEVNHPVLGKQQSVRIVGTTAEGKPFEVPDALDMSFRMFQAEKQFDLLMKKREGDRADRMAAVAEKNADTNEAYRKDLGAAATARADAAGTAASNKGKSAVERMSEADKEEYRGLKEQIKMLETELTKADLSGMADDTSPGVKRARTKLAALNMKSGALLRKYGDDAPDPVGMRGGGTSRPMSSMELVQSDMAKNGVTDATFDNNGQTITFGKGGSPAAIAAGGGVAAPAAPPVAPPAAAPATGDTTLNRIQAESLAAMKPLNDAVATAKAHLAAVAKSGDPVALQRYATALTQAVSARDQAAQERFGNRAPQYLASLPQ